MSLDLTARTLTLCECYTIELTMGVTAYFTSHFKDLVFSGHTYTAIPIKRGEIQVNTDLQVDQVDISLGIIGVTIGTASYTMAQVVRYGFLRNAKVTIHRVDYSSPSDYEELYVGWVRGDVNRDSGSLNFSVVSIMGRLNELKVPTVLVGKDCPWQIYSAQCGLDPDDWDVIGTAGDNCTDRILYANAFLYSAHPAGYWTMGKVTFTSGDNTGLSMSVIKHGDGYVKLIAPVPNLIQNGDGFTAWPGCQGKGSICHATFNNYANFLGFEYMSNPEALFC